jgi:hypothetical protein
MKIFFQNGENSIQRVSLSIQMVLPMFHHPKFPPQIQSKILSVQHNSRNLHQQVITPYQSLKMMKQMLVEIAVV